MLPSRVYRILEFSNNSNKHELWGGNIPDCGNNWIVMLQKNILVPGWQVISFLPKKSSPVIPPPASFVRTKPSQAEYPIH